ncbi:MAG: NAD(P)/FAD-dependent oxidoreductase [Anaerolineae bacterium]
MYGLRYLIIGNGAAGTTAAETIRAQDPTGEITVVGTEPYPMYSRPGLAYVLLNEIPKKQVIARQPSWYAEHQINLVFGTAVHLNVRRREIRLEDGRILPYDRLLIATGARATPPPYDGADLQGVVYLDTLDGTVDLLRRAKRARRAVVIGGGITALELTEGLAHHGVETHYFVRRDRLWSKVFNEKEAKLLEDQMREHGVRIHYKTEAVEILGNRRGKVRGVRLKDGSEFKCDLVGVAIGVRSDLSLVQGTGIETDRGILVDEHLQTSVPNVYAAGDCAQVYDRWTQKHMMDVLWPSAVAEGKAAGLNMTQHHTPYLKGSPFNACLLYGLHISTIGQIRPTSSGEEEEGHEIVQHLSRGSSEVWFTHPRHYASAWSADGPNTIRLVLDGNRLVGALIIGNQSLTDALRYIIENEIDITDLRPPFRAGGSVMRESLKRFWSRVNPDRVPSQLPV